MFLLGESARKDQNQLVVRRRARRVNPKNDNCRGGDHTPLGNGEERREWLERVLLNTVGTGGNEEGMQLGVTRPSKPKQKN